MGIMVGVDKMKKNTRGNQSCVTAMWVLQSYLQTDRLSLALPYPQRVIYCFSTLALLTVK